MEAIDLNRVIYILDPNNLEWVARNEELTWARIYPAAQIVNQDPATTTTTTPGSGGDTGEITTTTTTTTTTTQGSGQTTTGAAISMKFNAVILLICLCMPLM